MATMIEKKAASIQKEIDKYTTQITRRKALLEKKTQKCLDKFGCAWTDEEFSQIRDTCTQEQYAAWFDLSLARDSLKEAEDHLANAEARFRKLIPQLEEAAAKEEDDARIDEIKTSLEKNLSLKDYVKAEQEYQKWLKWFKAECLKDGIIIEYYTYNMIRGSLKNGKTFDLYINEGYTERSEHCYTLYINREVIFTSGLFETAYKLLRN